MSDLVGNPEDRFSRVAAHNIAIYSNQKVVKFYGQDMYEIQKWEMLMNLLQENVLKHDKSIKNLKSVPKIELLWANESDQIWHKNNDFME